MDRTKFYALILLGLVVSMNSAFAEDMYPDFYDTSGQNWQTAANWTGRIPTAEDTAIIRYGKTAVIDSPGAVCGMVRVGFYLPGQLQINAGSLTAGYVFIGTGQNGTLSMSGGDAFATIYTKVGAPTGYLGTLEVTGGTYYSKVLYVSADSTSGLVKLSGGMIEIGQNDGYGLVFGTAAGTTAGMDITGTGVLKWPGNRVESLNYFKTNGLIYTSEIGKTLTFEFAGDYTLAYIAENFSSSVGDLDKSGMADISDLELMAGNWLQWKASSLTNPNPVIFAPHIAAINVDGNLSDWTSGSDWAIFGKWYEYGLTSTTKAKYAWNAAAKRLYIGIETTEPGDIIVEICGLMGDPDADPAATVGASSKAAFYELRVSGSTVTVDGSTFGRSIVGVAAGMYAVNGTTRTFEISTPVYTNWAGGTGEHTLAAGQNIYEYVDLFDDWQSAGDSQVANEYIYLSGEPVMQVGSAIRLLNALPATCSDMPAGRGNLANIAGGDCVVNLSDFAALANDWLLCTVPGGCQ